MGIYPISFDSEFQLTFSSFFACALSTSFDYMMSCHKSTTFSLKTKITEHSSSSPAAPDRLGGTILKLFFIVDTLIKLRCLSLTLDSNFRQVLQHCGNTRKRLWSKIKLLLLTPEKLRCTLIKRVKRRKLIYLRKRGRHRFWRLSVSSSNKLWASEKPIFLGSKHFQSRRHRQEHIVSITQTHKIEFSLWCPENDSFPLTSMTTTTTTVDSRHHSRSRLALVPLGWEVCLDKM